MRKSFTANALHVRCAVALAVLMLLGAGSAEAGERVKFKNGHSIIAEAVRIEGEVVYLTMSDGSEAGFPKSLVEMVEDGHNKSRASTYVGDAKSPRSPGLTDLHGFKRAQQRNQGMRMSGTVTSDMAGKQLTAGFRYKGSVDVAEAARASRGPKLSATDRTGNQKNVPGARPGVKTSSGTKKSTTPTLTPRTVTDKSKGKK